MFVCVLLAPPPTKRGRACVVPSRACAAIKYHFLVWGSHRFSLIPLVKHRVYVLNRNVHGGTDNNACVFVFIFFNHVRMPYCLLSHLMYNRVREQFVTLPDIPPPLASPATIVAMRLRVQSA